VRRFLRAPLVWIVAALITAGAVLAISSATDDEGGSATTSTTAAAPAAPRASTHHHHERAAHPGRSHRGPTQREVHQAVAQSPSPRLDPGQRQVARVVRDYVAALNAHDGGRACALFVPGALADVRFPRDRGGCAPSLSASIGYRDPRGFPVYARSRVARVRSVVIDGTEARVVATTVTRFADARQPSIEDDVIYLRASGAHWLIVKPNATLYRAIGAGNIPPQVLAPPDAR
jgi:hypothetical protein